MAFDSVKFQGTNKFPSAKYSIAGNYSTQKAPLRDDRIQPILVWKYLGTTLRGFNQWNLAKRIQNWTSYFPIFAEHDSPRDRKNGVFQLGFSIVLQKSFEFLICFLAICITFQIPNLLFSYSYHSFTLTVLINQFFNL